MRKRLVKTEALSRIFDLIPDGAEILLFGFYKILCGGGYKMLKMYCNFDYLVLNLR